MFNEKNIGMDEVVEARKRNIAGDDAWKLLAGAETVVVGKGKKFIVFDPQKDNKEEILNACLGRTGNLRAPTLKMGELVLVGFNEDMYATYIKQ